MFRMFGTSGMFASRMFTRRRCLALLVAGAFSFTPSLCATDTFDGVERVVAFGDIHGDYDRLIALLRTAKLVDNSNAWSGGKAHLVLAGDFLDRGGDSKKVMDLLISLEPQAEAAGGRVHALIGNHEAMNLYGDLRYVPKSEFDAYRTPQSGQLRDKELKANLALLKSKGTPPDDEAAFRRTFETEHPLGWVEHRLAFSANGKYGKWLRQQDAIIRINDAVFLHGGIGPKYASASIQEINRRIHEELNDFDKLPNGMAQDGEGPLWYRGLAEVPENDAALARHINVVLERLAARHIVIGHTPKVAILPRFGGKVIVIDVGLSKVYGGPPAFLVMEGSKYYAVHRGTQLDLPVAGENVLGYLRAAAALDPLNSRLRNAVK